MACSLRPTYCQPSRPGYDAAFDEFMSYFPISDTSKAGAPLLAVRLRMQGWYYILSKGVVMVL